jgi:peroxiredoxin Q/BCP
MAKLGIGDPAPPFSLQTQTGETVTLSDVLSRGPVVLMFYPMDQTPGCTAQLCTARDTSADYAAAGVQVYGVNGGDARSHARFVEKHNLSTPLLVDSGLAVASSYDAVIGIGPLKLINRTVVGIAPDGKIAFYKRGSPGTSEILASFTTAAR